jgi:hypothetical protein
MRIRLVAVLGLGLLLTLVVPRVFETATPARADEPDIREGSSTWIKAGAGPAFLEDELVMELRRGFPREALEALNRSFGTTTRKVGPRSGLVRLKLPPGADVEALLARYRARPEIAGARRAPLARVFGGPNDSYYNLQWHLDNSTPNWGGIPGTFGPGVHKPTVFRKPLA